MTDVLSKLNIPCSSDSGAVRNGEVGPLLLLLMLLLLLLLLFPVVNEGVVVVVDVVAPPADGEGEERRLSRGKLPFVLILKKKWLKYEKKIKTARLYNF